MNRILFIFLLGIGIFQFSLFADSNVTTQSVETIMSEVNSVEDVKIKAFVLSHELGMYLKKYNVYFVFGDFDSARILLFLLVGFISILGRQLILLLFELSLKLIILVTGNKNRLTNQNDLIHSIVTSAKKPFLWVYFVFTFDLAVDFLYGQIPLSDLFKITISISHLVTFSIFLGILLHNSENRILKSIRKYDSDIPEENISFYIFTSYILIAIGAFLYLVNIMIPNFLEEFTIGSVAVVGLGLFLNDHGKAYLATFKIIFSKIIKVGVWITGYYDGKLVDGTIVRISLNYTEVRLFDQRLLILANTKFVDAFMSSNSKREVRQVKFDFYLPISTDADLVNSIIFDLRSYINRHPYVSMNSDVPKEYHNLRGISETRFVHLVDMKNGFMINIYCYVNKDDWELQRDLKQDIMLACSSISKSYGIRVSIEGKYIQAEPMDSVENKLVTSCEAINETKK